MKALILIICGAVVLVGAAALALARLGKTDSKKSASQNKASVGCLTPEAPPDEKLLPLYQQSSDAFTQMAAAYAAVDEPEFRSRINELMLVTDRILQTVKENSSELPKVKKFFSYYIPTTLKLIETYRQMSGPGMTGENIAGTKQKINEMLDIASQAYAKQLDSLFADRALDIETDIDVMNQILAREGLSSTGNFSIK